jgi:sulfur carrier protein
VIERDTISISVNGKPQSLAGPMRLSDFLIELGVDPRLVALAYNEEVVPRANYGLVQLTAGDRVEVVRMVGGG